LILVSMKLNLFEASLFKLAIISSLSSALKHNST
jgi:hypothetical protein